MEERFAAWRRYKRIGTALFELGAEWGRRVLPFGVGDRGKNAFLSVPEYDRYRLPQDFLRTRKKPLCHGGAALTDLVRRGRCAARIFLRVERGMRAGWRHFPVS